MQIIQDTIKALVPRSKHSPHTWRWWNKELDCMRKQKVKLNNLSNKKWANPDHTSHRQLKEHRNRYIDAIRTAKSKHWTEFLKSADKNDLWTAAKYIDNPAVGEGGGWKSLQNPFSLLPLTPPTSHDSENLHCPGSGRYHHAGWTAPSPSPYPLWRKSFDSMHLLVYRIKHAWRNGRLASVLFLDIEGAFPNVVKESLLHNMRMRRVPESLVQCVDTVLTGRRTKLCFDDYTSDNIPLTNGIGQGNPLSMIIYLFYNTDLLDIAKSRMEMAVAFVNDTALFAEAATFADTHVKLRDMMNRRRGAFKWSATHNSKFEVSKFALVDFSRKKNIDRPPIILRQTTIEPTMHHKFLGVYFNQELWWRQHIDYTVSRATKWIPLFKRITRTQSGLSSQLLRHLNIAVVVPKITPIHKIPTHKNRGGSTAAVNWLTLVEHFTVPNKFLGNSLDSILFIWFSGISKYLKRLSLCESALPGIPWRLPECLWTSK